MRESQTSKADFKPIQRAERSKKKIKEEENIEQPENTGEEPGCKKV